MVDDPSIPATRYFRTEVGPVFDWIIRYFTARSAENTKNGFSAPDYSLLATGYPLLFATERRRRG
jgi:hypothetical protein